MSRPLSQDVHIDQALTKFSLEYKNSAFVGSKLLPDIPVKKESDIFFIYGRQDFKRYNTKATPRAKAGEFEYTIDKQQAYNLIEYKFADFVPQRVIDNADEPLKPELDATRKTTNVILLDLEYEIAALATNSANYPTGQYETLSGTTQWSDYTNSNPVMKVDSMRTVIQKQIGIRPNTLIVSENVHAALKMHPVIRDVIKYTSFGKANETELAKVFEVDNYVVAGATYDSQKEAVAETRNTQYVWNNVAILAYVNPNVGINDISFGMTFRKSDGRKVLKEYTTDPEGIKLVVKDMFAPNLVCNYAGYLLKSVVA